MNAKIATGGIVAAAAIAAGVYFSFFNKGGSDDALARERADKILSSYRQMADAEYKSARSTARGVVIRDITFKHKNGGEKPLTLVLAELNVSDYDWVNPIPHWGEAAYRGLRHPEIKQREEFKEFSAVTGLDDVVVNITTVSRFAKDTKTLEIPKNEFEVEKMGVVTFTMKVDGIDLEQLMVLQKNPDLAATTGMSLLAATRLHGLRLAFTDAGAVAKVLKYTAHKQKKSEDQVRSDAIAQLAVAKASPYRILREAGEAAEKFIKNPGTIAIEAKPKAPVPLAQFMTLVGNSDPATINKLTDDLGLSVTAK